MSYKFYGSTQDFASIDVDNQDRISGVVQTNQEIPQEFLDKLKAKKEWTDSQSFSQLTKGDDQERFHFARIPVSVIAKWELEGFDFNKELASATNVEDTMKICQKIADKLKMEDKGVFLLTDRTIA